MLNIFPYLLFQLPVLSQNIFLIFIPLIKKNNLHIFPIIVKTYFEIHAMFIFELLVFKKYLNVY